MELLISEITLGSPWKEKKENIKPSGVKVKAKTEQANNEPKPHPSSKEAAKKYTEIERKLEEKLGQVFSKSSKINKKSDERKTSDQPSWTTSPKHEKELKQPGQLRKISINRDITINLDK